MIAGGFGGGRYLASVEGSAPPASVECLQATFVVVVAVVAVVSFLAIFAISPRAIFVHFLLREFFERFLAILPVESQ